MSNLFYAAAENVPLWTDFAVVLLLLLVVGLLYLAVSE